MGERGASRAGNAADGDEPSFMEDENRPAERPGEISSGGLTD